MNRFLVVFAIFVLLLMVAVYLGWFRFSSSESADGTHEGLEITMDKGKIKDDSTKVKNEVKDLAHSTSEGFKKVVSKVDSGLSSNPKPTFQADRKSVELEPGAKTAVKITRTGKDLPEMRLTITATPSSHLIVTGGEFRANEVETALVIEAGAGATGGTVNIEDNGASEQVTVVIKPAN